MTIAVEFVNDGCSIRDAAERVGVPFKTVHRCFFNCKICCNILYFRAKKRVDAGGSCLGVRGSQSVFGNKSLDDLKRTATLRDLGQNSFTEVQLMDALTKRIVAEQKAARCTSSSYESSDEREIENTGSRSLRA